MRNNSLKMISLCIGACLYSYTSIAQTTNIPDDETLNGASESNPVDMTSFINNPSFEDNFTSWTNTNLSSQSNSSFALKEGSKYVEKWTSSGSYVGNAEVKQLISGLPAGEYKLTASAQNIQQNSTSTQSGAYIYAGDNKTSVNKANTYEVTFTYAGGSTAIGFIAQNATGNWIACDNFQLFYIGKNDEAIKEECNKLISEGESIANEIMQQEISEKLNAAIQSLKNESEDISTSYTNLYNAIDEAKLSIEAYSNLQEAINNAEDSYSEGLNEADALKQVIDNAKNILSEKKADNSTIETTINELDEAVLSFNVSNSTGTAPTVTTYPFAARGATTIFGRSTISGSEQNNIIEKGFCWSTSPEPTIFDNRTTDYINNNGYIYRIKNLQPATKYYVRAYAISKDYAVGYGEVLKVYTNPKGNIKYTYNYGGPSDANERINNALASAVDYWNEYTTINGLSITCSYGSGTPTADCSYGGWMRVGPNASYQRTGTIMHEMGHAVGVGTHSIWYGPNAVLRANGSRGNWLGERANEVLRFWNNDQSAVMTGDQTHMWPYGINGAHEDNGTEVLYIGNSLITQGLCEDGLPPTYGFCQPTYTFDCEDNVKYYLKNESEDGGLYTSYLKLEKNGWIKWVEMSASEAVENDSAAWYISYNPENCYYQLKNVATGKYLSYNSIKFTTSSTVSDDENFHLMKSRVNLNVGSGENANSYRGYWIIHPENKLTPYCLSAGLNSNTLKAVFNLGNDATKQRWIILSEEECISFEKGATESYKSSLSELISKIKELASTPHYEDVEGADNNLNTVITDIETACAADNLSITKIQEMNDQLIKAAMTFLGSVTPNDKEKPFDLTFFMSDPEITDAEGWSTKPTISYSCAEFYQSTFNFNQTITGFPAGTYMLKASAFQRPGSSTEVYNNYVSGKDDVNTVLYINSTTNKVANIAAEAQDSKLGGTESSVGSPVKYIPNNMQAASIYFNKGLYESNVVAEIENDNTDLKLGIKCTSSNSSYWTIFDDFHLYYYGSMTEGDVTAIENIYEAEENINYTASGIYSITGIKISDNTENLNELKSGIYIVNGKKIIIK